MKIFGAHRLISIFASTTMTHIMKYLITAICILLTLGISSSLLSQQNKLLEVSSAEEQIVYNLKKGLPRYQNVRIVYEFELIQNINWSETKWTTLMENRFIGFRTIQCWKENGKLHMGVMTEGHASNHDFAQSLADELSSVLKLNARKYILK